MSLALRFQPQERGWEPCCMLQARVAFYVAQTFMQGHPRLLTQDQNTPSKMVMDKAAYTSYLGSSRQPGTSKWRIQQLFWALLDLRQAGRFSKQICQPPHKTCLLLQPPQQSTFYLILFWCLVQLRIFFVVVMLSFLAYQNLKCLPLCWKVLYLILASHFFHFSRISAACSWRISS